VGAKVQVTVKNEQLTGELAGVIEAFSFRYRKNKACEAAFRIREE
jgi:hypothetical protein